MEALSHFRVIALGSRELTSGAHAFLGALASAALMIAAQPPFDAWPLAYLCLVPWLCAMRSTREGAMSGFVLGVAAGIGLGTWLPATLERVLESSAEAWLAWVAIAVWLKGVPFLVLGAVVGLSRGAPLSAQIGACACSAFALDWLQGVPPMGLPWALLGHSQWRVLGVAQLAALGGVPLVSAVLVASNVALAGTWTRRRNGDRMLPGALGVVGGGILSVGVLGLDAAEWIRAPLSRSGREDQVLGVQLVTPHEERWIPDLQEGHLLVALSAARRALREVARRPDLVVLPETVVTSPWERNPSFESALLAFAREGDVRVVLGVARSAASGKPDRYRNAVLAVDPDGRIEAGPDKVVGVPILETEPRGPWRLLEPLARDARLGPKIEAGATPSLRLSDGRWGAVLCYEILFPSVVAERRRPAALGLLYLADDSWAEGEAAAREALVATTFRAIETRATVVRVAQAGISAAIDPYGRPLRELAYARQGHFEIAVRASPPPAPTEALALGSLAATGAAAGWWLLRLIHRRRLPMKLRSATLRRLAPAILFALASPSLAEESLATLHLDGLSFLSLDGRQTFGIPSGSTIGFQLGTPRGTSLPFTIQPAKVSILPIDIGHGATLRYALASATSGAISRGADGQRTISFPAAIRVSLDTPEGSSTTTYSLQFTTETASAKAVDGKTVEVRGMRLVEGANYVQLVGAVTNRADAYLEPGVAVTTVLSGTFDELPPLSVTPLGDAH